MLINESTASVSGYYGVGGFTSPDTVVNAGTIAGSHVGAILKAGGSIDNGTSGLLFANLFGEGVLIAGCVGAVTNAGVVCGQLRGVKLAAGGSISNATTGRITSTYQAGAYIAGATGTITNAGTINGRYGAFLSAGGTIVNQAGGLLAGTTNVAAGISGGAGTIINAGTINGHYGAALSAGGTIVNQAGALLTGTFSVAAGISGGAGTVINAGTITGAVHAVRFIGNFTDRLIDVPGAVFSGDVEGGGGSNTLELAAGTNAVIGTLTSFGSQFTGFGSIVVDTGARWAFDASDTFASRTFVTDNGMMLFREAAGTTLTAPGISGDGGVTQNGDGALLLGGNDSFGGGITIGGGTLELSAGNPLGAGPIAFIGDATIRLDGSIMPTGTLHGLAAGDRIDLAGALFLARGSIQPAASIVNGNTLELTENSGTFDLTLDPAQSYGKLNFELSADFGSGTVITADPACFCAGTRILTPCGEVAVEDLRVGHHVVTASGSTRTIRWVGVRRLDLSRHAAPDRAAPIRIRAHAFADGVPGRDLLLSPDHAVVRDGLLIPAALLVNGATITREMVRRWVTYYHIELDEHAILLAENLPAESYLDTGNRGLFDNASSPTTLHPDFTGGQARRVLRSCLPFADRPTQVEPIWRNLAARAEENGWRRPSAPGTTDDPALCALTEFGPAAPTVGAPGRYEFTLPRGTKWVRLVSRNAMPSETAPWISDSRRLGVMLRALRLRSGVSIVTVPLDHPGLREGWWQPEWHGPNALCRWINGDAVVELPHEASSEVGPWVLEVGLSTVPYPLPGSAPLERIPTRSVQVMRAVMRHPAARPPWC